MSLNHFFIAFAAVFLFAHVAFASGWQTKTDIDSMTDQKKIKVEECNPSGYCLSFYTVGKHIWSTFSLPNNNADILSSDRLPMVRVDKNEPFDMKVLKSLVDINRTLGIEETIYVLEPKWINWGVSDDKNFSVDNAKGLIGEFINGQKVVFRFWLFTGGYKETSFDLNGLKPAIVPLLSD